MEMVHCDNCGKITGHRRALGMGTLFAAIITAGLWIFVTPFYPKRCIVCGQAKKTFAKAAWLQADPKLSTPKEWYQSWWAIGVGVIILALMLQHCN
jgi:hypothetical protein